MAMIPVPFESHDPPLHFGAINTNILDIEGPWNVRMWNLRRDLTMVMTIVWRFLKWQGTYNFYLLRAWLYQSWSCAVTQFKVVTVRTYSIQNSNQPRVISLRAPLRIKKRPIRKKSSTDCNDWTTVSTPSVCAIISEHREPQTPSL